MRKKLIILTSLILILCTQFVNAGDLLVSEEIVNEKIIDTKLLQDIFKTDNIETIKNEIFTTLVENKPTQKEATFTIDTTKLLTEELTIKFNEICGKVISYDLVTPKTCYETKTVQIANNETQTIEVTTPYECDIPYDTKTGIKDVKIKNVKITDGNCLIDGTYYRYLIDWQPVINIEGNLIIDQKWAWWNTTFSDNGNFTSAGWTYPIDNVPPYDSYANYYYFYTKPTIASNNLSQIVYNIGTLGLLNKSIPTNCQGENVTILGRNLRYNSDYYTVEILCKNQTSGTFDTSINSQGGAGCQFVEACANLNNVSINWTTLLNYSNIMTINILNTSYTTYNRTPTTYFNYTSSTTNNASCSLYMDYVLISTNTSVINNTKTFLTTSVELPSKNYTTYILCTNLTTNITSASDNIYINIYTPFGLITFKDENSLGLFNMSSPDSMAIEIYFTNGATQTILINGSTSNPYFLNTSSPISTLRILEYYTTPNVVTIYRTYLSVLAFNITNLDKTLWLLDLRTTDVILNTLQIFDLMQDYTNPRVLVTKLINSSEEIITGDYADVEGKISAYLMTGAQYNMKIYSDNKPTRVVGKYYADQAGIKYLRLFDVVAADQTSSTNPNIVTYATNLTNVSGTYIIYSQYNGNYVTSVKWDVYNQTSTGGLLTTSTVTTTSGVFSYVTNSSIATQYLVRMTIYLNCTNSPVACSSPIVYDKTIKINEAITIPAQFDDPYTFKIIIFLIILIIALSLNMKTAHIGLTLLVGFVAFLSFINWFTLGVGLIGVCIIVALTALFRKGSE